MPIYLHLVNLTEQGVKDIKNAPQRVKESAQNLEAMGGKILSFYLLMGEYDGVFILEAPNDEVAMTFAMRQSCSGYIRIKTLKAFTVGQLSEMVKGLP